MALNLNKRGFALVTLLPLCFSISLGAIEPIDPTGEYYYPPISIKKWSELTPQEQQKAEELGFDRQKFALWLSKQPNAQKWANAMGYNTKPKK